MNMAENVESIWIDSHCHWDFDVFDHDREHLWQSIVGCGGRGLIIPGTQAHRWQQQISLCEGRPWFAVFGIHPYFLNDYQPRQLQQLEALITSYRPIAVGEIGLDYALPAASRALQHEVFERQLALAAENQLPVILHAHKAYDQVAAQLKQSNFKCGGIVHGFSGSQQQAERLLECGMTIGVGGVISRPSAQRLRALMATLPEQSWVLETDAPDMTPAFWGAKRNDPRSLVLVAQQLASLRGCSLKQVLEQHMTTLSGLFPALRNLPNL